MTDKLQPICGLEDPELKQCGCVCEYHHGAPDGTYNCLYFVDEGGDSPSSIFKVHEHCMCEAFLKRKT